jgi:hypothetical protein
VVFEWKVLTRLNRPRLGKGHGRESYGREQHRQKTGRDAQSHMRLDATRSEPATRLSARTQKRYRGERPYWVACRLEQPDNFTRRVDSVELCSDDAT